MAGVKPPEPPVWVNVGSITVTGNNVDLTWATNQVKFANAKYTVLTRTNLADAAEAWVPHAATEAPSAVQLFRDALPHMHRATLTGFGTDAARFFKVKAEE